MNIEWSVADVIPVRFTARAKRDILGMILDVFWPIKAAFVVGEPLCDVAIPSRDLITLLRIV